MLAAHWPKRDDVGWWLPDNMYAAYLFGKVERGVLAEEDAHTLLNPSVEAEVHPPEEVQATERFHSDLLALEKFVTFSYKN